MSFESLQVTLRRIDEIRSRFESPATPRVDSGAVSQADDFQHTLTTATADIAPFPNRLTPALDGVIEGQAQRFGLDANLLKAVIHTESNFDPQAVSPAGAQGLMQLMPGTARELGVANSFDPQQNVAGGAKYLKTLMGKYQDLPKALAAYNAGPGAVDRHDGIPPYAETTQYVQKVLRSYQSYQHQGVD